MATMLFTLRAFAVGQGPEPNCGLPQWTAYWSAHNETKTPPRICAVVNGYDCWSDSNWWPSPDNSTPVNSISDPWSQARCGAECDAQHCDAFVYGYESYEVGGKDANVPQSCSSVPGACVLSNADAHCHVPRCYLRHISSLRRGNATCGTFTGGGTESCSQLPGGKLLPWGEFSVYKRVKKKKKKKTARVVDVSSCPSPPIDVATELRKPAAHPAAAMMNGVTLFDWQRRVERSSPTALADIVRTIAKNTSANWVVIAPMYMVDNVTDPHVRADPDWTMSTESMGAAINAARAAGMSVMLKIHIQLRCAYSVNGSKPTCVNQCQDWGHEGDTQDCNRGSLGCNLGGKFGIPWDEAQWSMFFETYGKILTTLSTTVVAPFKVDAFCISTELTCATTALGTAPHWRTILTQIRTLAPNTKLTIAMHDKDLKQDDPRVTVGFLDAPELDWLGFDAYHHFDCFASSASAPSALEFSNAWAKRGEESTIHHVPLNCTSPFEWYRNVSETYGGKPIVFTEWGFTSTAGCGTGKLSTTFRSAGGGGVDPSIVVSEACQANAFAGTVALLSREAWWGGGAWWDFTGAGFEPTSLGADGKLLLQSAMREAWK